MLTLVDRVNRLTSSIESNRDFLSSSDNRWGVGTLTTTPPTPQGSGGPVAANRVYPVGDLLHHVLTRRSVRRTVRERGRRKASTRTTLTMVTYRPRADGGRVQFHPCHSFDLLRPIDDGCRARDRQALPGWVGWLVGVASELVDGMLFAELGRLPVDPDLRMSKFWVKRSDDPDHINVLAKASVRAAQAVAAGTLTAPACVAPFDAVVRAVITGYQDRKAGSDRPRTLIELVRADDPRPLDERDATVIELPEAAVLEPAMVGVALGQIGAGTVRLAEGTRFAFPVPPREYNWKDLTRILVDGLATDWLVRQGVMAADASAPSGMRAADHQDPGLSPVVEQPIDSSPLVRVTDLSYNQQQQIRGIGPAAVEFDVWKLPN